MLYLNQHNYPDIQYLHNLENGGPRPGHDNISSSGCGLCCLCMMIENMTLDHLDLIECRDMSYESGANMKPGTDLKILAPAVAGKFGLDYSTTNDKDEMMTFVQNGGMAIANAGGDREGYIGVFTHGGHYVLIISTDGKELCILDPSYEPDKFDEEGRQGKVDTSNAPFLYCSPEILDTDCENRDPRYYLFRRKML